MIRNSILYRRMRYVRRRHSSRLRVYIYIIATIIICLLMLSYAEGRIFPYLSQLSEYKARSLVTLAVNNSISESFINKMGYDELVDIQKDGYGRITSIQADTARMNQLAAAISVDVQNKLLAMDSSQVDIPVGALLGNTMLSGIGPSLKIRIITAGNIEADFRSEFTSAGINQTRHTIYLDVRAKFAVALPYSGKDNVVETSIPFAETVIVGNVPGLYVNTSGGGDK